MKALQRPKRLLVGVCPQCGIAHPPEMPHNANSEYYRSYFKGLYKRLPSWSDAMRHSPTFVKDLWLHWLVGKGVDPDSSIDVGKELL